MSDFLKPYLVALLVLSVLDAVWLGWLARDFYRQALGDLMADPVRWGPALVFYFGFPAAVVALALFPAGQPLAHQVARAALVGLVAYGVYDMTNLATLKAWSLRLALVDIAWGTLATTLAGGAAAWMTQRGA